MVEAVTIAEHKLEEPIDINLKTEGEYMEFEGDMVSEDKVE
jgi:hypothetical protein